MDLTVGQFQVSDPMFKRELRLEFEDYAVYRARMGGSPVDLTYDRGIVASADLLGFGLTGQVLNGNGCGPAQPNRRFDNDFEKKFALHLTRDVISGLRLGAFGLSVAPRPTRSGMKPPCWGSTPPSSTGRWS